MRLVVTGGAGFIGSALIREIATSTDLQVLNLDNLSHSVVGEDIRLSNERYEFLQVDIADRDVVSKALADFRPEAIIHLAADTHVDRSIELPITFVETNVVGTASLLEAGRAYWDDLRDDDKSHFRFIHVSTDEVFGDLNDDGSPFGVESRYEPSSPYAASKAGADHLVRAWFRTYGFPTVVVNTTNNYGPRQHPEKLIPHMIFSALEGRALPVYGDGLHTRDWLYVEDNARGLLRILEMGEAGRTYLTGASTQIPNIEVVRAICHRLDERAPDRRTPKVDSYFDLVEFVNDRPGHDRRYALDPSSMGNLGWRPDVDFADGLRMTVDWYLANPEFWAAIRSGGYRLERRGL